MKKYLIILLFLLGCSSPKYVNIYGEQQIALYEHSNMHFINVELNGIKTKLLIDTGASTSLLDISKSEELGFSYILLGKKQYVGLGGFQDIYVPYDFKLNVFTISFLGADLSDIQEYFIQDGIYIVGIIGSDFLQKNNAIIDFKINILYYNR